MNEDFLQLLLSQAQPRKDLGQEQPTATFLGRAVNPGTGVAEAMQRTPQAELETGGLAMQSPDFLKQLAPLLGGITFSKFATARTPRDIIQQLFEQSARIRKEIFEPPLSKDIFIAHLLNDTLAKAQPHLWGSGGRSNALFGSVGLGRKNREIPRSEELYAALDLVNRLTNFDQEKSTALLSNVMRELTVSGATDASPFLNHRALNQLRQFFEAMQENSEKLIKEKAKLK